jgi:catechol 2,3-dioxygenase-like lactoylglutathione lyase family enzyme
MTIEHVAFPAQDPVAVAGWYVENLGLRVLRQIGAPTYTHFLADDNDTVIEIYNNPLVAVPDYVTMHPLLLHVAFNVDDIAATRDRLLAAGCTAFNEIEVTPVGDTLAMLRDPWGLALQLVKRHTPMI